LNSYQRLVVDLGKPNSAKEAAKELNQGYYMTSFLEDDYLYHTTCWGRLKNILKEGFLTGNPVYLEQQKVHPLHPHMVCFTTSKWRHLSSLPDAVSFFGLSLDCYLQIPYAGLKGRAKPVVYEITDHDIKSIFESDCAYHLASLTQNGDDLKAEYGELWPFYLYRVWWIENEWRIKTDNSHFPLPPETEVFVSDYYQLKQAKRLTKFPVHLDRELMKLKDCLEEPGRITRRIDRVIGKELARIAVKHVAPSKNTIKRPDGSQPKLHATLYDVSYLNAITIVPRLRRAGWKVWIAKGAWKFRAYADIEIDLK
jgi:hypothetical protein